MRFLSRIWEALGTDRHLMVWSVLLGLLFTGLGIIPPLLVREMIRWVRDPELAGSFWLLGCGVAVVYLLRGGTRYLYGLCSHIAAYRTLHRLSMRVYEHLQRMSPSYLNRHHSGNLVARTIGDVEAVEDYIAHGIPESMLAIVIPATLGGVLFAIDWQLAMIALAPLPVIALLVYLITSKTRNAWRGTRRRFAEVSASIQDHLAGLTVIQSFVREAQMAQRVKLKSQAYRDRIIYANKWSLVPAGVIEAASGAGFVLLIWAGGWMQPGEQSQAGLQVDVADLVVLLMYLGPNCVAVSQTGQSHGELAEGFSQRRTCLRNSRYPVRDRGSTLPRRASRRTRHPIRESHFWLWTGRFRVGRGIVRGS